MFKILEPNRIFYITSRAPKYVLFLFTIVLSIGLLEALVFSPEDYKQSDAVRIMYVHVPAAWISLGTFSSITLFSICGFVFKNKMYLGAFDVILKILLGSKSLNISYFRIIFADFYYEIVS